jgi:hypothetical protein
MSDNQQERLELLNTKRRRLNVLERQAAQYGRDCPAHIILEIEDLRTEVANLEGQLGLSVSEPSITLPKESQA